jgi:hypothetical protein
VTADRSTAQTKWVEPHLPVIHLFTVRHGGRGETRLRVEQPRNHNSIPGRVKGSYSCMQCPASSGTHPASYLVGTGGSFPVVKVVGA